MKITNPHLRSTPPLRRGATGDGVCRKRPTARAGRAMNIFDSHRACGDFDNRRDNRNGRFAMLVLCRTPGESLVIQRSPDTLTRIKVVRVQWPMIVLAIETLGLDGALMERRELRLRETS
ncbi:hypothetical protein ACFPU0_13740 [Pseudomonas sp. GCM10022186]|uniref:hypothetical protein n=1 Tax=Pseudomonas sp. GCM10022186 TaxID=3252650 RepID=UPI00361E8CB2